MCNHSRLLNCICLTNTVIFSIDIFQVMTALTLAVVASKSVGALPVKWTLILPCRTFINVWRETQSVKHFKTHCKIYLWWWWLWCLMFSPTHVFPSGPSWRPAEGQRHRISPWTSSQPYWQWASVHVLESDHVITRNNLRKKLMSLKTHEPSVHQWFQHFEHFTITDMVTMNCFCTV